MNKIWDFIDEQMETGSPVTLMVVAKNTGSTPGKPGFKLAVTPDTLYGTIGGGIMEHNLVEETRAAMAAGSAETRLLERIHREDVPDEVRSGMICAGSQLIACHPIRSGERGTVTALGRAAALDEVASFSISPDGISFRREQAQHIGLIQNNKEDWVYRERAGAPDTVYIIGGGHVGLALSRVLELLDLRLHVFDHRPDVATLSAVSCTKTITPYNCLAPLIPEGDHSYVVIVTSAFLSDALALEQVIGKKLKYLGLMGSKTKLRRIFEQLRAQGIDPELFNNVKAPIGIPIEDRTPAEIAVSIAAQIIQVRNRGRH